MWALVNASGDRTGHDAGLSGIGRWTSLLESYWHHIGTVRDAESEVRILMHPGIAEGARRRGNRGPFQTRVNGLNRRMR